MKVAVQLLERLRSITKGRQLSGRHGRKGLDRFIVGETICVMIERKDAVYVYWPKKIKAPALTHFFDAYGS